MWLASLAFLLAPAPRQAALPPGAEVAAEVLRVIDGDTLELALEGEKVLLRIPWVDTEEKISGRASSSSTKPQTVFGEETAHWARAFFAALGTPPQVGLAFPEGRRRDVYGRLLGEVILPDGRDFGLLLVEQGFSPYFNKYGNHPARHAEFVRAQDSARARELGIWNPATNRARTPGAPSALRPYDALVSWWQARAEAIDAFRARARAAPEDCVAGEDPEGLARALARCARDPDARVTLFAEVWRLLDGPDGGLTVLLRQGEPGSGVSVHVPRAQRAAVEPLLRATLGELRQNFVWVRGRLERARGTVLVQVRPEDWSAAEPAFPAPDRR